MTNIFYINRNLFYIKFAVTLIITVLFKKLGFSKKASCMQLALTVYIFCEQYLKTSSIYLYILPSFFEVSCILLDFKILCFWAGHLRHPSRMHRHFDHLLCIIAE